MRKLYLTLLYSFTAISIILILVFYKGDFSLSEYPKHKKEFFNASKITLDIEKGDVEVVYGFYLEINYYDHNNVDITNENDTYTLKQTADKAERMMEYKLIVPSNYAGSIDIKVGVGDVEIEGVDLETLNITTNVGSVEISKFNYKKCNIKVGVGSISIDEYVDIKYNEPLTNYNLETKTGTIYVDDDSKSKKYKTEASFNVRSLTCIVSVGNIEVNYR